jgi:hypothetical protein
MLSLWSELMFMSGDMDMAISSGVVVELTVWQSEWAWCNQQDKSQAEAETEVEIIRSDSSAANKLVSPHIEPFYSSPGFFLNILRR